MTRGDCRTWWSSGYYQAFEIDGGEVQAGRRDGADEAPWEWELALDDDEMGVKLGGFAATQQDALAELQLASLIELGEGTA